ncbi:hypothetical protein GCM10027168_06130 [Streptomyces capparidis]
MTATRRATGAPSPRQLERIAEVVLARPVMAEVAAGTTPREYAARNAERLRLLWETSPPLREAVRRAEEHGSAAARPAPPPPSPAPDAASPAAGEPCGDRCRDERVRDAKLLRRADQRARELRDKVDLHRGREQVARQEAEALRERVRALEERAREAEEAAAATALERDALSRRARDPLHALRTLHRALRPADGAPGELRRVLDEAGVAADGLRATLDRLLVPPRPAAGEAPRAAVTAERALRVVPLGGGEEIGGSCVLVELAGTRILVDAGVRQDDRADKAPPPGLADALREGPPIRAVVVTHAHNDHCGYVPALVARVPGLRVLCSPPTAELLPLMWRDAADVLRRRSRDRRAWGDASADALYGPAEVGEACRRLEDLPYGTRAAVGDLTVELFPAGHVLGSAGVVVGGGGRRVVVGGDVSVDRQLGAEPLALPDSARDADLLLLESTCCDVEHRPRRDTVDDMVRAVRETCEDGGRVLFPAMALGRAQEIALCLGAHLPGVPVLLDGLAATVAEVYGRFADGGGAEPRAVLSDNVTKVTDRRAQRLTFRRGVVISTSGTLRGGPAVDWARDILPDPAGALFVSGFQDEESPGRRLLELAEGARRLELPEGPVEVRAAVRQFQLGAHADRHGLLSVLERARPRRVMLVHGRPAAQHRFRHLLAARGETAVRTGEWLGPGT